MKTNPDPRHDEYFGPIDRFFLTRIDRALDDARPLDALTDRYLRRRPRLRSYYESMLMMELELRFADCEEPIPVSSRSRSKRELQSEKRNRLTGPMCLTAVVLLVLATAVSVFIYRLSGPVGTISPADSAMNNSLGEDVFTVDQRIDLADLTALLTASFSDVVPPSESLPFDPFQRRPPTREWPTWERSVEPLVEFTEKPLETTFAFLEQVQILRYADVSADEMKN